MNFEPLGKERFHNLMESQVTLKRFFLSSDTTGIFLIATCDCCFQSFLCAPLLTWMLAFGAARAHCWLRPHLRITVSFKLESS